MKALVPVPNTYLRLAGALRQWMFPVEFRIASVARRPLVAAVAETPSLPTSPAPPEPPAPPYAEPAPADTGMVTDLAQCLWYLKTKFFRRDWKDLSSDHDDPRVRRALGRLHKGIESLNAGGYQIHDPTNERYPDGGEAMMRPLDFVPTPGLGHKVISETVAPLVYRGERLLRRGEVFVAVPEGVAATPGPQAGEADGVVK